MTFSIALGAIACLAIAAVWVALYRDDIRDRYRAHRLAGYIADIRKKDTP